MSWCRWGSPCWSTMFVHACDAACNPCPGSSLYIYESSSDPEGSVRCCDCPLLKHSQHFIAVNEDEMLLHIEDHAAAGHHVRASLRLGPRDLTIVGMVDVEAEMQRTSRLFDAWTKGWEQ